MVSLFDPINFAGLTIKNRFVHSATYEAAASKSGEVTEDIIKRYRTLAKGGVGLIIPGFMFVHPHGRAHEYQIGAYSDELIPGLRRLMDAVHKERGKIVCQLVHAGLQTDKKTIGTVPVAPSARRWDPIHLTRPRMMLEEDIEEAVLSFTAAAERVIRAGADGVQIHAAHGYLVSQFLSPFFNDREDDYGGSAENRFRFLKQIVEGIQGVLPKNVPLLVKLNAHDYTPKPGVTPELAAYYAGRLVELNIDGLEISCGTMSYSFMNTCRGQVPVKQFIMPLPLWKAIIAKLVLDNMAGKFDLHEGYNLEAARLIKPIMGDIPLILVGGLRRLSQMEYILNSSYADCISMSRPFIREPFLVKKFQAGKRTQADCISCNKCLAGVSAGKAVQCFYGKYNSAGRERTGG